MPRRDRPFESIDELHEERMECFATMLRAGAAVAVPAALQYCYENKLNAPPWLLGSATDLFCDLLKREKSQRRGRSCGFVARYRQDMIDYSRWDQVIEVRDKQQELKKCVEELRKRPNVPQHIRVDRERMQAWAGTTLNRAFECAAMLLEGSAAYGSPEAIKRSYFQVRRNNRDPSQALRYHQLDIGFLGKIGLKHEFEIRPGRKFVPLYELAI
jgi:hypothetical protein